MRTYISRTDANHRACLAAARAAGCSVADTHAIGAGFPDCVIGLETERGHRLNLLVEIKKPKSRLNAREQQFAAQWHGQYVIVCSPLDMIEAIETVRRDR